jgi:hypothetical protein
MPPLPHLVAQPRAFYTSPTVLPGASLPPLIFAVGHPFLVNFCSYLNG